MTAWCLLVRRPEIAALVRDSLQYVTNAWVVMPNHGTGHGALLGDLLACPASCTPGLTRATRPTGGDSGMRTTFVSCTTRITLQRKLHPFEPGQGGVVRQSEDRRAGVTVPVESRASCPRRARDGRTAFLLFRELPFVITKQISNETRRPPTRRDGPWHRS